MIKCLYEISNGGVNVLQKSHTHTHTHTHTTCQNSNLLTPSYTVTMMADAGITVARRMERPL